MTFDASLLILIGLEFVTFRWRVSLYKLISSFSVCHNHQPGSWFFYQKKIVNIIFLKDWISLSKLPVDIFFTVVASFFYYLRSVHIKSILLVNSNFKEIKFQLKIIRWISWKYFKLKKLGRKYNFFSDLF